MWGMCSLYQVKYEVSDLPSEDCGDVPKGSSIEAGYHYFSRCRLHEINFLMANYTTPFLFSLPCRAYCHSNLVPRRLRASPP